MAVPIYVLCERRSHPASGLGGLVAYVDGELDLLAAPVLEEAVRRELIDDVAAVASVTVDAVHLTFLDLAGVNALLRVARRAAHFEVVGACAATARLLSLVGLSHWLARGDADAAEESVR